MVEQQIVPQGSAWQLGRRAQVPVRELFPCLHACCWILIAGSGAAGEILKSMYVKLYCMAVDSAILSSQHFRLRLQVAIKFFIDANAFRCEEAAYAQPNLRSSMSAVVSMEPAQQVHKFSLLLFRMQSGAFGPT